MHKVDLWLSVQDAQRQAGEWFTWVLNTQVSLATVLGLSLFIALLYVLEYRGTKRDVPMAAHNKQIVQYALGDALTELYLAEQISVKDYHYWNHRLADEFGMESMRVRKVVKKRLAKYMKAQYEARKKERKVNGTGKPLNIPGPKPGEGVTTVDPNVSALRTFFSKFAQAS